MGFALRDNLTFCVLDRHVVFLDIAADRYLGVSEQISGALLRLIANEHDPGVLDALKPLIQDGVLIETAGPTSLRPATLREASRSLVDSAVVSPVRGQRATALASLAIHALELRFRALESILAAIRRRKQAIAEVKARSSHIGEITGAYLASGRLISPNRRCLLYSLALTDRLIAASIPASLVFAVKLAPFAAHCWVQHDDCVLNDSLDHSRLFTPILVV
ncbi:lasso peptide biosynthesis B2 protein [Flavisphingomonas formosensis]|uniref:lasso peptide biosynthesis B2 protein n=1 Tax=Flavisphingomonas formosensis TaxID=861534 RepID=UPI0012F9AE1C|nr:lasso peptide biosynthesis B2 protein [Sphingomonas formosensis]